MSYPAPFTILPDAVHFKEFYGGFTGTCGEAAATAALICALKLGYSHDQAVALMLAITAEMQARGWASANGASTLWSLAREVILRHATAALEYDYQEPLAEDWHAIIKANAGVRPIVLQVGKAYNLWGQDGSGNDEAGVHYHFITVVGICPDGYICMDGDNWKIEQQFAIYSFDTLNSADICGLLMLEVTPQMGIPNNWSDSEGGDASKPGVLTAPNKLTVSGGFREHILTRNPAWPEDLVPVSEEHSGGAGITIQDFALKLYWDANKGQLGETTGEAQTVVVPGPVQTVTVTVPGKTDPAIIDALNACAQYFGAQSQLATEVAAAQSKVVG